MTKGFAPARMGAALSSRQHIALGFDGPRASEYLPMCCTGNRSKGRRRRDQLCTGCAQGTVQLGKAQVIANGHTQAPDRSIGNDDLSAEGVIIRLAVDR